MNLSVVILPAKVLTDGQHKIRIAMSHNCETRYYVTRFKVPSSNNVKRGAVVGVGNASYINEQLRSLMSKMYKAFDEIDDAECYTCPQLLEAIKNKLEKKKLVSFYDIAEEWICIKNHQCAESSIGLYKEGIAFFVEFAGENYILSNLTTRKIYEYDDYIVNKRKLSTTTANMRIKVLRYVYKYAVKKKYFVPDSDPFDDYSRHAEVVRDTGIDVTTLRKIRDVELTDPNAIMCRDFFMLSFYLCGMNQVDIVSVDLSGDYVSFVRTKTKSRRRDGIMTEFSIQPEAKEILKKYLNKDGKIILTKGDNRMRLHNIMELHKQKVIDAAGCGDFLFYSARKTFAQLANMLGIRERIIEYCIGDKQSGSVISYYIQTNKQMADEAIRKVLDFVASDRVEEDLFK